MRNGTMFPGGYNLRHGATAGEELDPLTSALVPTRTEMVPFPGLEDEERVEAYNESWADVAEIVGTELAKLDLSK